MTSKPLAIGIPGAGGRMGGMLIREIAAAPDMELVAATARPGSDNVGRDSGELVGTGKNGIIVAGDAKSLFAADLVIDFTTPALGLEHARLAAESGKPLVIGTTGMGADVEAALARAAKKAPVVYCANTSLGVTLVEQIVERVAGQLDASWDIEIFETHHNRKVDAPSGTALALGEAAARGRGVALGDVADMARKGKPGARKTGDIGFAVARGGDVAGEHSVTFHGQGERVQISHMATSRAIFAKGALRAARFAAVARPGLYSMRDVLGG